MTETRDSTNPFDHERHRLGIPEIRKLCHILGSMYDLHPLNNMSDVTYPTFQICPATFIRYLHVSLSKAIHLDRARIIDVRLAGGAASHIVNPTEKRNEHGTIPDDFNDLDFVFNLEIEGTDHKRLYDKIRDICVECLKQFAPQHVQALDLKDFAKNYIFKQMRVLCSKDEDNCWVLVSTNNTLGKTIDLLFVHKMRRRFIFPTDSFRIILDDAFLAMIQHAREDIRSPSYAHIPSVAMHVQPLRLEGEIDSTTTHAPQNESKQNGQDHQESSGHTVERQTTIHNPVEIHTTVSPPTSSSRTSQVDTTIDISVSATSPNPSHVPPGEQGEGGEENKKVQENPSPQVAEPNTAKESPKTNSKTTTNGNNTPNSTKSGTPGSTSSTPTMMKRGRKKRRRGGRKKRNSQSQSRINAMSPRVRPEERSAGSAPPETPGRTPSLDQEDNRESLISQSGNESSSPRHRSHQHRRGVSLDAVDDIAINNKLDVMGENDDFETRKAQSLPPTLETETLQRPETPPGQEAHFVSGRPRTVSAGVQTDSLFDDDSSMRDSVTTTSSYSPRGSLATSMGSGIPPYHVVETRNNNPNWNALVRYADDQKVECLALHESYETAFEDLHNKRIRFYRPEEVRGGGLLKYCELLQRKYTLCEEQKERKMYFEQLILNRFVNIDYIHSNDQRAAINGFLMRHFRNRTVEALHFLINIKYVVQQLQEVAEQHSAQSLLEIVQILEGALRDALQKHQVRSAWPSERNGGSGQSAVSAPNGATHRLVPRQRAQQQHQQQQQLFGMHPMYPPYHMYAASTPQMGYQPMYRSTIGMLAHAQPQQFQYHQNWRGYQSAFISVPALGTYGTTYRRRYEGEAKEEEMPRRRKNHYRSNHTRTNGHHNNRYSNSSYPRQSRNRHGHVKSQN